MKILGINTATNRTAVAMVEMPEGRAKAAKTLFTATWESNRDEAEKVLPAISKALKKGTPYLVFVVKGPGSFTGLRIGVTIANTLAFIFAAPVSAVSTFDFLRARIPLTMAKKTAVMLKAGGDFAAVLLPEKKTHQRLSAKDLPAFFAKQSAIKHLVGDMNTADRKKFPLPAKVSWLPEKSLLTFADVIKILAAKKIRHTKMAVPQYLLPPKITQSKKPVFNHK